MALSSRPVRLVPVLRRRPVRHAEPPSLGAAVHRMRTTAEMQAKEAVVRFGVRVQQQQQLHTTHVVLQVRSPERAVHKMQKRGH